MTTRKEAVATAQLKLKLVQHLRDIPIATYACQRVGVPKATYYKWRKTDEVFLKASNEAIATGKLTLNDIAKSQLVKLIKEGDYRSISFWLKHNDDDFNSKLTLKIEDEIREYDPKELMLMETAMKNAGLVGITLAHKKLESLFRRLEEKKETQALELTTYEEDAEMFEEETETERSRKGGIKVSDIAKRFKPNDLSEKFGS